MNRPMFESFESRTMLSVSIGQASISNTSIAPTAGIHLTPLKKTAVSFIGTYSGRLSIPGLGYGKSVTLSVKTLSSTGAYTGVLSAKGVTISASGVVTKKGFTISLTGSNPATPMVGTGTGTFDAGYMHLNLTMSFKPGKKAYAGTVALTSARATVPVTLPSMVGTYSGTLDIPAVSHYKNAVLNITSQNSSGLFSGTLTADSAVSVNVTGTIAANRTFTVTVVTPANTNHPGGPINGTGTGTLDATGKIVAMNLNFTAYGTVLPGTVNVSKA